MVVRQKYNENNLNILPANKWVRKIGFIFYVVRTTDTMLGLPRNYSQEFAHMLMALAVKLPHEVFDHL